MPHDRNISSYKREVMIQIRLELIGDDLSRVEMLEVCLPYRVRCGQGNVLSMRQSQLDILLIMALKKEDLFNTMCRI